MYESLMKVITGYGLISGFAIIGATMWISYWLSDKLTKGRLHGSAVAILIGLLLSYIGGVVTGGQKGLVDIALFSGIGLLGGFTTFSAFSLDVVTLWERGQGAGAFAYVGASVLLSLAAVVAGLALGRGIWA